MYLVLLKVIIDQVKFVRKTKMEQNKFNVLDGTACLGKTSILKLLQNENIPVQIGDYAEDAKNYSVFKEKAKYHHYDLEYQMYVMKNLVMGSLHDRGPWSNVIYNYIFRYMATKIPLEADLIINDFKSACQRTFKFLSNMFNIVIIVCMDRNGFDVAQRMKIRGNGIDVLNEEYVYAQNLFFKIFARECNLHLIEVIDVNDFKLIEVNIRRAFNLPFNGILFKPIPGLKSLVDAHPPLRGTIGSAGLDLYNYFSEVTLTKNTYTLVRLGLAMEIPKNHFGRIFIRSSYAKKGLFCLDNVIDSDYRGEIGVFIFNTNNYDFILPQNKRIVQIVLIPYTIGNIIMSNSLPETERGLGGFGSTN